MSGRFRCKHCGDYFDLPKDENEMYEQGYFMIDPDCCDDCNGYSNVPDYPEFSDADSGL